MGENSEVFGEASRSIGCLVSGEQSSMDRQHHRIATEGDNKSEHAACCVENLAGHAAGDIKRSRAGLDMK